MGRNQGTTALRELERVAGKIQQNLSQAAFIGMDDGQIGGDRPGNLQTLFPRPWRQEFGNSAQQAFDIGVISVQLDTACAQLGATTE